MQIGEQVVNIRIIGKNHDIYADGSGTAPLTFETVEIVENRAMHSEEISTNGWAGTDLYAYVNNELLNSIDPEVSNKIKPVLKLTNTGNSSTTLDESINKIFILSLKEIFGEYSASGMEVYNLEGSQYEYYLEATVDPGSYNTNAAKLDLNGEVAEWWTRTLIHTSSDIFFLVQSSGVVTPKMSQPSVNSCGVSLRRL